MRVTRVYKTKTRQLTAERVTPMPRMAIQRGYIWHPMPHNPHFLRVPHLVFVIFIKREKIVLFFYVHVCNVWVSAGSGTLEFVTLGSYSYLSGTSPFVFILRSQLHRHRLCGPQLNSNFCIAHPHFEIWLSFEFEL